MKDQLTKNNEIIELMNKYYKVKSLLPILRRRGEQFRYFVEILMTIFQHECPSITKYKIKYRYKRIGYDKDVFSCQVDVYTGKHYDYIEISLDSITKEFNCDHIMINNKAWECFDDKQFSKSPWLLYVFLEATQNIIKKCDKMNCLINKENKTRHDLIDLDK